MDSHIYIRAIPPVSKSTSVVEVNGNQYDAVSGQLIGVVEKITKQVKQPAGMGSIDGFARRAHTGAQAVHRRAQRSQTLMRSAVKRPDKAHRSAIDKNSEARSGAVDPLRFSRARSVSKSMKVSRFGQPSSDGSSGSTEAHEGEVLRAVKHTPARTQNLAVSKPLPSMVTSASHQQLERLLDLALVQADSHKQRLNRDTNAGFSKRIRASLNWKAMTAGLAVIVLVAAFFAWQRVPQVALKVAAARAHVSATMPGYVPRGYSFSGPVKYGDRSVTIRFVSSQDAQQSFELTQKASKMNSTSFAATTLPKATQIQTSQINGTTVYIYGPTNNAAWVNNGVAYTIKDGANLNSDQLLRIADSL